MKRRVIRAAVCCMLLAGSAAHAIERVVWGEVTHVRPITERLVITPAATCNEPKPPPAAGLAELLAWDLRAECSARERSRITAYEVHYRWDGRTYSKQMDEHPGKRIPLLLKLN